VIITFDDAEPNNFQCNKTFAEVAEAWGKQVIVASAFNTASGEYEESAYLKKNDDCFYVNDMFYIYSDGTHEFAGGE
jgi:hypothetical protein